MINYSGNFQPKEATTYEAIPVGAYVGKVIDATVETVNGQSGNYDRLTLKLDVTEGDYAGYYSKLFESQSGGQFQAKYKGIIRYTIPQQGSQYEQGQLKALEHLAWCLMDSNKGFTWDGDENKIKGLAIGFSVRERDWLMEQNGELRFGTSTEIGRVESVNKIKSGEVKPMKKRELRDAEKKKLADYNASIASVMQNAQTVDEDDLPF